MNPETGERWRYIDTNYDLITEIIDDKHFVLIVQVKMNKHLDLNPSLKPMYCIGTKMSMPLRESYGSWQWYRLDGQHK